MADPHELARRLARRRSALLTRPPRAWCLAIRASDRRITPAHWIISPEHAMDLDHPAHPYEPIEHEVIIRPHALRKFCRPVRTDSWGEEVADVCAKLGISRSQLLNARWTGLFTERFIKGLGGKHGRYPIPLIHSWTTLDPSSGRHFSRPDPLWGSLWEFLADRVPDDFEQTIVRRPHFRCMKPGATGTPGRSGTLARHPIYKDDLQFRGWHWLCPACKKEVRTIYYPFPAETVFDFLGYDPARAKSCRTQSKKFLPHDADEMPTPPPTFACWYCHRIDGTTRTTADGWNQVVSHLTRGLLFGHEVEKPQWYQPQRKNTRSRRLHAKPAVKRQAVFVRLMNGWTTEQIARDLLIPKHAVELHIQRTCKQERVKNRHELAAKLGWKHAQPQSAREKFLAQARQKQEKILALLLQGLTRKEIARQTGLELWNISQTLTRFYKKQAFPKSHGKREFANQSGLTLPRFGHDLGQQQSTHPAPTQRSITANPLHAPGPRGA
jgi:DNA-binding NarL/FixJ family response regulator